MDHLTFTHERERGRVEGRQKGSSQKQMAQERIICTYLVVSPKGTNDTCPLPQLTLLKQPLKAKERSDTHLQHSCLLEAHTGKKRERKTFVKQHAYWYWPLHDVTMQDIKHHMQLFSPVPKQERVVKSGGCFMAQLFDYNTCVVMCFCQPEGFIYMSKKGLSLQAHVLFFYYGYNT